MIFGRRPELAAISSLLDDGQSNGGLVVIEGAFGSGKTELLREAGERAGQRGFCVLSASADIEEQSFGFGVVQQLFESWEEEFTDAEMRGEVSFETLHGLHRRLVGLSRKSPVLVTVDNLEFTDEPSLRWIDYVVRRTHDMPVSVIATLNPGEKPQEPHVLSGLLLSRLCRERRRLLDLGLQETAGLMEAFAGGPVPQAAVEGYHRVTGGNPLLLRECLRVSGAACQAGDIPPVDPVSADLLAGLMPMRDRLLAQLHRADPRALTVAGAAALLGDAADEGLIAVLANLSPGQLDSIRAKLAALGILRINSAAIRYPLIGALLENAVPPAERTQLHARAARALHERGAAPEEVAVHVVEAGSFDEPWAGHVLLRAGESMAASCPQSAVRVYERVLQEPIDAQERVKVLARLGMAQLNANVPAAVRRLEVAMDMASEPEERAEIALGLSCGLAVTDRHQEAVRLLDETMAKEELRRDELAERMAEQFVVAGAECRSTLDAVFARIRSYERERGSTGRCPGGLEPLIRAWLGRSAEQVLRPVQDVLSWGRDRRGTTFWYTAATSLLWCEEFELASWYAEEELRATRSAASLRRVRALLLRMQALHGLDHLEPARQCGVEALDLLDRLGIGDQAVAAAVLAPHVMVLAELDEREAAATLLAERGWQDIHPTHWHNVALLHSRARLRIAAADHVGGLADTLVVQEACRHWHMRNPAIVPWQVTAAECQQALKARPAAQEAAAEGLAAAQRWGSPRLLGQALRTMGLSLTGPRRIELLQQSAELLKSCGARLELARTLGVLGTATREKRSAEARRTLREAYELAVSCGGKALARCIQEELVHAGGRITQSAERGVDLLTGSELQVAEMAASGMTNQAIARRLKVSLRNIEAHLTHTYRKLGVTGRRELADLLRRSSAGARAFGAASRPAAALPGAGWTM
ncbi:DNA-binding CsgD family transcriptional regulator [Streptomyces griseochromogenes]|uniref:DNA-binding CsgD family transcriptional regulator n=1 Tax=Streptomyces griseochromogenes TaxID=68214 RepID=A0ABS4LX88_9ACTN|nr:LuxR family transcriptional regulator [Streptomyces griseochromogenes]MBP2051943.1 DNA-binding CsgD family transcriptional regulator [Streptomyces griseochromogenes]